MNHSWTGHFSTIRPDTFPYTHIRRITADQIKKVSFQLGGKNQAIVFADADIGKGRSKLILVHTFKTNTGKILTVKPLRIQAFL